MKLFDILKEQGLFSKDIKTRFQQKQVLVNGESVEIDFETEVHRIREVDELIFELCANPIWAHQMHLIGIENIMGCNIQTDLKEVLKSNLIVRTSKKNVFVIQTNE